MTKGRIPMTREAMRRKRKNSKKDPVGVADVPAPAILLPAVGVAADPVVDGEVLPVENMPDENPEVLPAFGVEDVPVENPEVLPAFGVEDMHVEDPEVLPPVDAVVEDVPDNVEPHPEIPQQLLCVVCEVYMRNTLFLPCKHAVSCGECSKKLDQCPICREPINFLIKDILYP